MKTDEEIRNEVLLAMQGEPILNQTELNIVVKDGIVTMMGTVNSLSKKFSAWRIASGIQNVRAVELAIIVLPALNVTKEDDIKRFF